MSDSFHVDMSGRIYENRNIGIAVVGTESKENYGCALKGNLIKLIKDRLFRKNLSEDSARLYAICIYILIKDIKEHINLLIICNDEDFKIVREKLSQLLKEFNFDIISITDFRESLGRKVGSLADNYANIYRKKALKQKRWSKGKELQVKEVTFNIIKPLWEETN